MSSIEITLKGRVQGVCCRMYCREVARSLGLRGAASNLMNGDVQVILATPDEDKARKYVEALRTNKFNISFYGYISNISVRSYDGVVDGDYVW